MDEVNKIRKQVLIQGKTRNQVAKELHYSWDTVNRVTKIKREDLEKRGKRRSRERTVMTDTVMKAISDLLDYEESISVKRKQRYTAFQIYKELSEKGIYHGSQRRMETVVRDLRKKRGQVKPSTFLPLDFPMGSALQVDHGEAEVEINGQREKAYLFVASVPGHSLRYCQAFPTKASESWGEFHERGFKFFGGIFSRVIYDNDSVLVKKVVGKERKQTSFSISLEEHYGFESHFCNLAAGNEKGAVENGVGYCRRNFLSGLPAFENWDELNKWLASCCLKDIDQKVHYKTKQKLSKLFSSLKEKLNPLRAKKSWYRYSDARVDKCQLVTVDCHKYSVPERFVGSRVRVAVTHNQVEIMKDNEVIATYAKKYTKEDSLTLDHYLNQLRRKPGALPYAKVSKQAVLDTTLLEMKDRLSAKYGDKKANKEFVDLLILQRRWDEKAVIEGVKKALDLGAIDTSSVENLLRQKTLTPNVNIEDMQKISSIPCIKWDFNLSVYKELCEEVAL